MVKYDPAESWTENAMAGVDMTEPEAEQKRVIMVREKISRSKEWVIDPKDPSEEIYEVWSNEDCEPFWNEYYRVCIFDPEEYEEEYQALCEVGEDFYDFAEAYECYKQLKAKLGE